VKEAMSLSYTSHNKMSYISSYGSLLCRDSTRTGSPAKCLQTLKRLEDAALRLGRSQWGAWTDQSRDASYLCQKLTRSCSAFGSTLAMPALDRPEDLDGELGRTSTSNRADELMKELQDMIGLDSVKAAMVELRDMVEFDMWRKRFFGRDKSLLGQSFHMRFLGNPGTGKTVVSRIVGELLVELEVIVPPKGAKKKSAVDLVKEVSRADLIAEYVGQTAPKVKEAVKEALGGVLFIDEAYAIVQDDGKDTFGHEAVDTLIAEMENKRKNVVVIMAGYENEMKEFFKANAGLESRVPFTFHFDDYNCEQLDAIGDLFIDSKQMVVSDKDSSKPWLSRLVRTSTSCCKPDETACTPPKDSGNGRSVRNILDSIQREAASRIVKTLEHRTEPWMATAGSRHNCKWTKENKPQEPATDMCNHLQSFVEIDVLKVVADRVTTQLRRSCSIEAEEKLAIGDEPTLNPEAMKSLDKRADKVGGLDESQWTELDRLLAGGDCAGAVAFLDSKPAVTVPALPSVAPNEGRAKELLEKVDGFIGLESVKAAVRTLYATVLFNKYRTQAGLKVPSGQAYHMQFLGNPGTGKTTIARVLGELLIEMGVIQKSNKTDAGKKSSSEPEAPDMSDAMCDRTDSALSSCLKFLDKQSGKNTGKDDKDKKPELPDHEGFVREVTRGDLVGQYTGSTATLVKAQIQKALGNILFIDEAYALKQEGKDSFGQEAVDTLIAEMENRRSELVVILAGYENDMRRFLDSNPGFKSRVPFTFNFDDYSCEQLVDIGGLQLKTLGMKPLEGAAAKLFAPTLQFESGCCNEGDETCRPDPKDSNGRDVRNVVERAMRAQAQRLTSTSQTDIAQAPNCKRHPEHEVCRRYLTLAEADVASVLGELAQTRVQPVCGATGEIAKVVRALSGAGNYETNSGAAAKMRDRLLGSLELVRRLQNAESLVNGKGANMTKVGQALRERNTLCTERVQELRAALVQNANALCGTDESNLATWGELLRHLRDKSDQQDQLVTAAVTSLALARDADWLIEFGTVPPSNHHAMSILGMPAKTQEKCQQSIDTARNFPMVLPLSSVAGTLR